MSGRMPLTDAAHVRMSMLEFLQTPFASRRAAGVAIARITRAALRFGIGIDAWLGEVWAGTNKAEVDAKPSDRCGIAIVTIEGAMFKCARRRGHDGQCAPRKRRKEK